MGAADARTECCELQARYMKMEADLQESEAARALLQKQLHRVQDAMKQNRNDLEDAQRAALAAEGKAAAAEASAAALSAEVCMQVTALYTDFNLILCECACVPAGQTTAYRAGKGQLQSSTF